MQVTAVHFTTHPRSDMDNRLQIVNSKWKLFYNANQDMPLGTSDINKRQSSSISDLSLIYALTFLTGIIMLMAIYTLNPKPRLENHPMCGLTTGGMVG